MRALELSIVLSLVVYLVYLLSPLRGDYIWLSYVPLLCLPVVAFHLLLEGYRWQMLPVYLLLCASVLYALAAPLKDAQLQYLERLFALGFFGFCIYIIRV